jgi:hypothetical protein
MVLVFRLETVMRFLHADKASATLSVAPLSVGGPPPDDRRWYHRVVLSDRRREDGQAEAPASLARSQGSRDVGLPGRDHRGRAPAVVARAGARVDRRLAPPARMDPLGSLVHDPSALDGALLGRPPPLWGSDPSALH